MDETRTCYGCTFETVEPLRVCPQCGNRLRTVRTVRRLGWVGVGLGSFLVLFMGGIGFVIARIVVGTGRPGATTTFTGDAGDLALIYGVLWLVAGLGLVFVFAGAWQIRYGRPNRKLVAFFTIVAILLVALGRIVRHLD
jgi:hypothetical protein